MNHLGPSTKRKKNLDHVDELAQDDSWDSDKIGYAREQYNPRPSRRRSGIDRDEHPVQADADVGTGKRKRQKIGRQHEAVQEDTWDSDKIGAHRESYKPRPSRRRSRAVLEAGDEDSAAPERSMPDTCPPGPVSPERPENAEPILVSSGQQAPQEQSDVIEGIDPSYLAALPEDLRQEVIADQLARNSQASRTRGRGRPIQDGDSPVPLTEENPKAKKRGRKKKETGNEGALTVADEADPQGTAAPTPAAGKKKRGRPRKSEVSQPPQAPAADDDISLAYEVENGSDAAEATPPPDIEDTPAPSRAPSKRGRKKKVVEETPAAPEEETSAPELDNHVATNEAKAPSKRGRKRKMVVEELPSAGESGRPAEDSQPEQEVASDAEDSSKAEAGVGRKALTDISNAASSHGPAHEMDWKERTASETSVNRQRETTPEAKAKETSKSGSSTTSQQGKVPLRVGLSKRSRIAPLLKIIRK